MAKQDHQGGKRYGLLTDELSEKLDKMNEDVVSDGQYSMVEDLEEKLSEYKMKFLEFDENKSGDIDLWELGRMMEKLGKHKNQLELKKMIQEVDSTNTGTINYIDFLNMMLGKKNSILRIILMFEEKGKEKEKPKGLPPKKTFADLP